MEDKLKTPTKPTGLSINEDGMETGNCPNCNKFVTNYEKTCSCGQNLLWNENKEDQSSGSTYKMVFIKLNNKDYEKLKKANKSDKIVFCHEDKDSCIIVKDISKEEMIFKD